MLLITWWLVGTENPCQAVPRIRCFIWLRLSSAAPDGTFSIQWVLFINFCDIILLSQLFHRWHLQPMFPITVHRCKTLATIHVIHIYPYSDISITCACNLHIVHQSPILLVILGDIYILHFTRMNGQYVTHKEYCLTTCVLGSVGEWTISQSNDKWYSHSFYCAINLVPQWMKTWLPYNETG